MFTLAGRLQIALVLKIMYKWKNLFLKPRWN